MVRVAEEVAAAYREGWAAWQKQLADLHAVFLEGKRSTRYGSRAY